MFENKKTILVVDDTETNIDILLDLLGETYDILVSLDGESAIEILQTEKVHLILLDIMMPKLDGFEVCQILKADEKTKDIPIIFISAKTEEQDIEKAYEVGGSDYVSKPFKAKELLARVKTQLKLEELIYNLEYLASFDTLTNIYNRRKFFTEANKLFEKEKEYLYAVMIDIDKFKNVNDTYGHNVGDKVIQSLAKIMSEMLPKGSVYGRVGGEEFAILCKPMFQDTVIQTIEQLREKFSKTPVKAEDGTLVYTTISEGIARSSSSLNSIDTLLKEADLALYEAKGSGRNKVIFR